MSARITHEMLRDVVRVHESDYDDYGGEIDRWKHDDLNYPDCSSGCRFAAWLKGSLGNDWCVCTKPDGPRAGMLTFEHQAGFDCFEARAT